MNGLGFALCLVYLFRFDHRHGKHLKDSRPNLINILGFSPLVKQHKVHSILHFKLSSCIAYVNKLTGLMWSKDICTFQYIRPFVNNLFLLYYIAHCIYISLLSYAYHFLVNQYLAYN